MLFNNGERKRGNTDYKVRVFGGDEVEKASVHMAATILSVCLSVHNNVHLDKGEAEGTPLSLTCVLLYINPWSVEGPW